MVIEVISTSRITSIFNVMFILLFNIVCNERILFVLSLRFAFAAQLNGLQTSTGLRIV